VIADTVPPKTIEINQKAFLTGYEYGKNNTDERQE
jgi:Pyruvate/2-oxoacid:ferredoxin oxidoreductase gamma subunit